MTVSGSTSWSGSDRWADGGHAVNANTLSRRILELVMMAKPRITAMVVVTVWSGFVMGAGRGVTSSWLTLVGALIGTGLSCMGASVLNQVWEQDTDALMRRTATRPLPAGRITVAGAVAYGVALSAAGLASLAATTNWLTATLSALTIISYVLVYTPMKRVNSASTLVGAVPGALPPVMGYTAATGEIGLAAVLMFAILFVWQLPHFLSIAWLYREEYDRAGLAVLPVEAPEGDSTFRQILLGCLALLPLGLVPSMLGITGRVYFYVALSAGVGFLALAMVLAISQSRRDARVLFYASLVYLPLIYGVMLMDRIGR